MKGPYSYSLPMNAALIGYARCSTDDQDLTAQVLALERLGVTPDRILSSTLYKNRSSQRPENSVCGDFFQSLLKA